MASQLGRPPTQCCHWLKQTPHRCQEALCGRAPTPSPAQAHPLPATLASHDSIPAILPLSLRRGCALCLEHPSTRPWPAAFLSPGTQRNASMRLALGEHLLAAVGWHCPAGSWEQGAVYGEDVVLIQVGPLDVWTVPLVPAPRLSKGLGVLMGSGCGWGTSGTKAVTKRP